MCLAVDDLPALDQTHFMRSDDFGALFENLDPGLVEVGLVDVGKAGDFAFLGGDQLAPVEFRRFWQAPTKSLGVGEILGETRGIDIKLFRHAAANDAGSADAEFLGDHGLGAMARRDARGAHAARTGADDEEIGS